MNNTLLLIKAHITNSFGINKLIKSSSKAEKLKIALVGSIIIFGFSLVFIQMFIFAHAMSDFLVKIGAVEVLLIIAVILSMVLCLFMSIYKGTSYLFAFKDFDLLMSLPIKSSSILMSKIMLMYLSNMLMSVLIGIPFILEYGTKMKTGTIFYISSIILMIIVPLVPITIGALISLLLGRFSAKHRSSNIILIIGTFILVIALYLGIYYLNDISKEQIINFTLFVTSIKSVYFPFGLFIDATIKQNLISLLMFIFISGIIFVLFIRLFSRSFKSINASMNENYKVSNYKMTSLKVSSPISSLYKKELNFYFSSYIYVLNTGLGSVLMLFAAIMLSIINKDKLIQLILPLPIKITIPVLLTIIFSVCCALTCTTSPSISLEGKNLWILKSLPIKIMDIFKSKILVNLTIVVPVLVLSSIILAVTFSFSFFDYLLFILITLSYNILISMLGLIVNLYMPKVEWKTQVVVVKQSASVVVSIALGFLTIVLPVGALFLLKPSNIILFEFVLLIVICCINLGEYIFLSRKGVKLFNSI